MKLFPMEPNLATIGLLTVEVAFLFAALDKQLYPRLSAQLADTGAFCYVREQDLKFTYLALAAPSDHSLAAIERRPAAQKYFKYRD
jgi:hypothetical protein